MPRTQASQRKIFGDFKKRLNQTDKSNSSVKREIDKLLVDLPVMKGQTLNDMLGYKKGSGNYNYITVIDKYIKDNKTPTFGDIKMASVKGAITDGSMDLSTKPGMKPPQMTKEKRAESYEPPSDLDKEFKKTMEMMDTPLEPFNTDEDDTHTMENGAVMSGKVHSSKSKLVEPSMPNFSDKKTEKKKPMGKAKQPMGKPKPPPRNKNLPRKTKPVPKGNDEVNKKGSLPYESKKREMEMKKVKSFMDEKESQINERGMMGSEEERAKGLSYDPKDTMGFLRNRKRQPVEDGRDGTIVGEPLRRDLDEEEQETEDAYQMGDKDFIDLDEEQPGQTPQTGGNPMNDREIEENLTSNIKEEKRSVDPNDDLPKYNPFDDPANADLLPMGEGGANRKATKAEQDMAFPPTMNLGSGGGGAGGMRDRTPPLEMDDGSRGGMNLEPSIIPPARRSSENKNAVKLNNDIQYFLRAYPKVLATEKGIYKRTNKKSLEGLRKLHIRIVTKLELNKQDGSAPKEGGKRIGVIVDADEFIQNKIKEVLMNNKFNNITASSIINMNEDEPEQRDNPNSRDIGDFEVVEDTGGNMSVQREATYRYIPTTNENAKVIDDEQGRPEAKSKYARIGLPKPKQRNQITTAKRMNKNDAFNQRQPQITLKYLY